MKLGGNAVFNVSVYEAMYGKIETAEVRPVIYIEEKTRLVPYKKKPRYLRKQNLLGKEMIAVGIVSLLCGFLVTEMIAVAIPTISAGVAVIHAKQNLLGEGYE